VENVETREEKIFLGPLAEKIWKGEKNLRVRKKRNPKNPIFSSSVVEREPPPHSLWIFGSHSQNQGHSLSSPSPLSLHPHSPSRDLPSLSPPVLSFPPTDWPPLFPHFLSPSASMASLFQPMCTSASIKTWQTREPLPSWTN
jgi:hypothetical protein